MAVRSRILNRLLLVVVVVVLPSETSSSVRVVCLHVNLVCVVCENFLVCGLFMVMEKKVLFGLMPFFSSYKKLSAD